eukprot:6200144-Pleurochrysis_carterae.AAC.2
MWQTQVEARQTSARKAAHRCLSRALDARTVCPAVGPHQWPVVQACGPSKTPNLPPRRAERRAHRGGSGRRK